MDAEIIVIDNNSTDGSRKFFENRFIDVKFTWCTSNPGFSNANNIGIKQAIGGYILFLNPDTIIPEDCLERCIKFFTQNNNTGALGVKMIDGSGRFLKESKRGFPDAVTAFFKLTGLTSLFPTSKIFANYYLGHLDEQINHKVTILAGAFMMTSRAVLDKAGMFDESFFMYGEDIDLSYRIQQAGYTNYYLGDTAIIHFKGESTKKGSVEYVRAFYGAMLLFVKKHAAKKTALYRLLIAFAIRMKTLQALTYFKRKKDNAIQQKSSSTWIVAGAENNFNSIIRSLDAAGVAESGTRRLQNETCAGNPLAIISGIKNLFDNGRPNQLVFCNELVDVKTILTIMDHFGPRLGYWFYLQNTSAIISSNNKETTGSIIEIKN